MDCHVIQDLLPLYVDSCCSEESARLVEDHLTVCPQCRRLHGQLRHGCQAQPPLPAPGPLARVDAWRASLLQSALLFLSFGVIVLGVILEGRTPVGSANGLWAVALIVPATGYLLSLSNWFFLRVYKSRKAFSIGSSAVTLGMLLAGFGWAFVHYAGRLPVSAPLLWVGVGLSAALCLLSGLLADRYARLLGRE